MQNQASIVPNIASALQKSMSNVGGLSFSPLYPPLRSGLPWRQFRCYIQVFVRSRSDDAACCWRLHPRLCLKSKTALMFSSSFPNVIRGWPVGDVLPPQSIVFGRLLSARTDEDRRLGGWRRPADVAAATATPHPS